MSDNLISRAELKSVLAPSKNFEKLTEAEKLYIIYSKLQSLEELYLEEKDSFVQDQYSLSRQQAVILDSMMKQSNSELYIDAYFSLLEFLEDGGNTHDDKIYLQELDELYLEIKKLILLIEQKIDFETVFSQLVEDFSEDSMIQFSFTDDTTTFQEGRKNIVLNGELLSVFWLGDDYEFNDEVTINKIKSAILDYKNELYHFSKLQEEEKEGFAIENYIENESLDECVGAIDGIMFAISNHFNHSELNEFYDNFKISLYHVVEEIIGKKNYVEDSIKEESPKEEEENEKSLVKEPYDDKKQKKLIAEMLDISLEEAYQNSQNYEELNAVYYWNPNGSSAIIDSNLDYLFTNSHVENESNLLAAYRELKGIQKVEENVTVATIIDTDSNINELMNNMIEEINQDYQNDRSIDNVFDFSDSIITDDDLDVFWKRVSSDALGYIIVKELEESNYFDLEILKQNINSFNKFTQICVHTELQSRNKKIFNISEMTKQAPEKTLRTIYDILCKSLAIDEVKEEIVEEVITEDSQELVEYVISSDSYFNFTVSLPARFESVTKNSESSFKIGDINVMIAKCSSFEKLDERANQWLTNSANTNSQTMLSELDREYYIGVRNLKVLEKQLEKNNKRRVYKFIYFNNAMLIFAYSSQNEELSDIIDDAIETIQIVEQETSEEFLSLEKELSRKLIVSHIPFHSTYGRREDIKIPEAIVDEYNLDEDSEFTFKDFKVKILEIKPTYVRIRIFDSRGVIVNNNKGLFKVDYQVGDCVGNIQYNENVHLYKDIMDANEYWDLRFE